MKLFTVGYAQWDCDRMVAVLSGLGKNVLVYDVRYSPGSRKPEFSRKGLSIRLGSMYIHAAGLGNIDYKSGGIRLADPEPWYDKISRHLINGGIAVLLCACARLDVCHRLIISRELERRLGITAIHLHPSGVRKKRNHADENTGSLF